MKTSTIIIIGIIAFMAAYAFGRYVERLATVQGEVCDLKMRIGKLEEHKMHGEVRWGWFRRFASHVPVVKVYMQAVVSTIYEDWFRMETYYRVDTRTLYKSILPELIRKAAEDVTAAKGLKLVRQDPSAPILSVLYPGTK